MSAIATDTETITVTLKREQIEALRALAEEHDVSIDELIADGIHQLLMTIEEDAPLFQMVGMIRDGPTDMAEKHDEYLTDMIDRESHPCP